jgi:hypothetical protein
MSQEKFNVGQYGFKPWMANLTMGLLEAALLIVWFLGSMLIALKAWFSLDMDAMINLDGTSSLLLMGGLLLWNLLVWLIKPLRTKFNYKETWYNLGFIAWTIYTTFIAQ